MVRINSIQKNEDGTFSARVTKFGKFDDIVTGTSCVGEIVSIKFEDPDYPTYATVVTRYGTIRAYAKCGCKRITEGVCGCQSFSFSDKKGKMIVFE